jgi:hypothetical protein
MELHEYISHLLRQHDCVIVPDFGGFVTNYKSAYIDDFRKKIHPPSKSVLFNSLLVTNDGLLGNYVAQQKSLVYSEALALVASQVKSWKTKLAQNERIDLGEIGFLYSKDGKIQFEQSRDVNLLLAAYGLQTIDFVSFGAKSSQATKTVITSEKVQVIGQAKSKEVENVHQSELGVEKTTEALDKVKETPVFQLNNTEKIEEIQVQHESDPEIIPIRRNVFGTVMKYAAVAAIVPLLFYSYWIPMETDALDTKAIQYSDFNPIHNQVKKVYKTRTEVGELPVITEPQTWESLTENIQSEIYNFELSEDFYVSVKLDKLGIEQSDVVESELSQNTDNTGNFHVISGCFSELENANALVADLKSKGFNAQIIDQKGGLHRVSAGAYADRNGANQGLDQVKSSGYSAWVLKK